MDEADNDDFVEAVMFPLDFDVFISTTWFPSLCFCSMILFISLLLLLTLSRFTKASLTAEPVFSFPT